MNPKLNQRLNKMKRNRIKGRSLLFALLLSGLFPSLAFAEGMEVYKGVAGTYSQYISHGRSADNNTKTDKDKCLGDLFVKVPNIGTNDSLSITTESGETVRLKDNGAGQECNEERQGQYVCNLNSRKTSYSICISGTGKANLSKLEFRGSIFNGTSLESVDKGLLYSPIWVLGYGASRESTEKSNGSYGTNLAWTGSFYGDIENGHVVEFKFDGLKGVDFAVGATAKGGKGKSVKTVAPNPDCNGGNGKDYSCINGLSVGGVPDTKYPLFINPPKYTDYATADSRKERQPTKVELATSGGEQCSSQTNILFVNSSGSLGSLKISLPGVNGSDPNGFLRVSCYTKGTPEGNRTSEFIDLSKVKLTEEDGNYIYDYSLPTGVAASGDYTCEVQHYVGEVHLDMADAETVGALRMYDVYKDGDDLKREPLYLFWDDSEVCTGGDCSGKSVGGHSNWQHVTRKTEGGVKSGAYKDNSPIGYHRISGASEGGNARAWGSYDSSNSGRNNIGNATMMDTWTYYGSSELTSFNFEVAAVNADSDQDNIYDKEETCISADPNSLDSDGDGIPDEIECDKDKTLPGNRVGVCLDSDGDGIPDILDLDSDNDGIPDTIEAFDKNHDGKVTLGDFAGTSDVTPVNPADKNGDGINAVIKGAIDAGFSPIDTDGDGVLDYRDRDSDNDGIPDTIEAFDKNHDGKVTLGDLGQTPANKVVDPATDVDGSQGINPKFKAVVEQSSFAFDDADGDSIPNYKDADSDGDGISDYDEAYDYNKDGVSDVPRNKVFNSDGKTLKADADHDGLADQFDPDTPTTCQVCGEGKGLIDTDGDTVPNYVDKDSDNDGIPDAAEARYPNKPADLSTPTARTNSDKNNNGLDDQFDPACMGSNCDGVDNSHGVPPLTNSDSGEGKYGDAIPDFLDADSDGDGLPDYDEAYDYNKDGASDVSRDQVFKSNGTLKKDADHDGLADQFDPDPSTTCQVCGEGKGLVDTDTDDLPNYIDPDSDGDSIPDRDELFDNADSSLVDGQLPDNLKNPSTFTDNDKDGLKDEFVTYKPANFPDTDGKDGVNAYDPDDDGDSTLTKDEVDGDKSPVESKLGGGPAPDYLNDQYPTSTVPSPGTGDGDGGSEPGEGDGNGGDGTDAAPGDGSDDGDGISEGVECDTAKGAATDCDNDGDGIKNSADPDSDGDGISDDVECGTDKSDCLDKDGDGVPDYLDLDSDNDAIPDKVECSNPTSCEDTDGDGTPDYLDTDSDNDGISDTIEAFDKNKDGVVDAEDIPEWNTDPSAAKSGLNPGVYNILSKGGSVKPAAFDYAVFASDGSNPLRDTDGDSTPDYRDLDSDNDGIPDVVECTASKCEDTDGDKVPNYLDKNSDNDGILDEVEAYDKNGDGKLSGDEFQPGERGTDSVAPEVKKLLADDSSAVKSPETARAAFADKLVDTDGDGRPNYRDADSDGDGISDADEAWGDPTTGRLPNGVAPMSHDDVDKDGVPTKLAKRAEDEFGKKPKNTDKRLTIESVPGVTEDELPDYLDPDSDGDGIPDKTEAYPANKQPVDLSVPANSGRDSNNDGMDDDFQNTTVPFTNSDSDSVPDFLDPDSDNDGLSDQDECGASGTCKETESGKPDYTTPADSDGDGVLNPVECVDANHPVSKYGTVQCDKVDTDGDGVPDYKDRDSDNDGLLDGTPEEAEPRVSADTDGDGILNSVECVDAGHKPNPTDGTVQCDEVNSDNDSTPDYKDNDSDEDSIPDNVECTTPANCEDHNNDGTPDFRDSSYPDQSHPTNPDGDDDEDGILNEDECSSSDAICPDTDKDGVADFKDKDSDNDGILDGDESNETDRKTSADNDKDGVPNSVECADATHGSDSTHGTVSCGEVDTDGDGVVDSKDLDSDNDGIPDAVECSTQPCVDTDGDGIPDFRDLDSDNDGILDSIEAFDMNNDGVVDAKDVPEWDSSPTATATAAKKGLNPGIYKILSKDNTVDPANFDYGAFAGDKTKLRDTDGDGRPNYRDADSDGDGISDADEAWGDPTTGRLPADVVPTKPTDVDKDGIPTKLADRAKGAPFNGTPKNTDKKLKAEGVDSVIGDEIPDYLDADSDGDGIPDKTEAYPADKQPAILQPGSEDNDSNNNGMDDAFEGTSRPDLLNSKQGTAPDFINADSDGDDTPDIKEGVVNADGTPITPDGDADNNGLDDAFEKGGVKPKGPSLELPDYRNPDSNTGNGDANSGTGNGDTNGGTGNGDTGDSNADANAENPVSFGIVAGGCSAVPVDGSVPASLPLFGFLFGLVRFFRRRKK